MISDSQFLALLSFVHEKGKDRVLGCFGVPKAPTIFASVGTAFDHVSRSFLQNFTVAFLGGTASLSGDTGRQLRLKRCEIVRYGKIAEGDRLVLVIEKIDLIEKQDCRRF